MKVKTEPILLTTFFVLLLWLGLGTYWDHTLSHSHPTGYAAADAYQHQVRAEWVAQEGYAYEAPYTVGGFENVVGYYMPTTSHLAALLSSSSGLPSWDALFVIVHGVAILSALVMYFVIRLYNRDVALLSLPLMFLIIMRTFYGGLLLGQWPFIVGALFLISTMWALSRIKEQRGVFIAGTFMGAIVLSHTSELVFILGLIGIALFLTFSSKDWTGFTRLIAAGAFAAAISIYYFYIFTFTWGKQFGYDFYVEHSNPGYGSFSVHAFDAFPLWTIMLMLTGLTYLIVRNKYAALASGLAAGLLLNFATNRALISSNTVQIAMWFIAAGLLILYTYFRKPQLVTLYAPYMILIGYASLVGFGPRSFQTRFMWPVTLAILFGIGVYLIVQLVQKQLTVKLPLALITSIGLSAVMVVALYEPITSSGTMYQQRWESFEWISQSTPPESRVLFFYGDGYDQTSLLYNTERFTGHIDLQGYVNVLNSAGSLRDIPYGLPADYGPAFPYWKGVSFGYHLYEDSLEELKGDICMFHYFVFDKQTGNPGLAQIIQSHGVVVQQMVNNNMSIVFNNEATLIVQNNNPEGDCLA